MAHFRKQLVLACLTIVLVIALGAVTGVTALRRSMSQQDAARTIDAHIALLEKLRASIREMGASARRYMISGDHKEQQRVLALLDDARAERGQLDVRNSLPHEPLLEVDLDEFTLGVLSATSSFEDDPVVRLTRFENKLEQVRLPLSASFDDVIGRERSRRTAVRDAQNLARSAEWTLLLASSIGVILVVGLCLSVMRRIAEPNRLVH
jgi:CHASE3 domain sensor protein